MSHPEPTMLLSIEYATLLQYSPRGQAEMSVSSREVRAAIKNGLIAPYRERLAEIFTEYQDKLRLFLHPGITLVPAPRSSLVLGGGLWPAKEIADMLPALKLGSISTCLERTTTVKKSAYCANADERPSVAAHYDSFAVKELVPTQEITLVDDILTLGRTLVGAASRLADHFPNAIIRAFALMQTRGRSDDLDIDRILNVQVGTITYNPRTGKCQHTP